MAVGHSLVDTAKISAFNADKPLILSASRLEQSIAAKWTTTLNATWSSITDIVNTDYPVIYATDRYAHIGSRAKSASESGPAARPQYFFVFDLGTSAVTRTEAIAIYPGNFDICSPTGNVDITVSVSTDSSFTSDTYTIARLRSTTTNASAGRRPLVELSLHNPDASAQSAGTTSPSNYAYFDFRYVLLEVTTGPSSSTGAPTSTGSNFTVPPMINEVMLGTRDQLSRSANQPFTDYAFATEFGDFESDSGVISRYTKSRGGRNWSHTFPIKGNFSSDADLFGLNDFTMLKSIWTDRLSYGTKSFIYIPNPLQGVGSLITTTASNTLRGGSDNVYLCKMDAETFSLPLEGPFAREVQFDVREVFPYMTDLVNYPRTANM